MQDLLDNINPPYPDWLARTLNAIHRIPPEDWAELTTPDAVAMVREYFQPLDLLSPLAQPFQDQLPLRLLAHIGKVDAVRFLYRALGWQLEVVHTSGMMLVWVDPAPAPGADLPDRIREVSARLLVPQRPWFFFPPRRGESVRFSTDQSGKVDDAHLVHHLDGGIVGGRLYFVLYYTLHMTQSGEIMPHQNHYLFGPIEDAWKARPGAH